MKNKQASSGRRLWGYKSIILPLMMIFAAALTGIISDQTGIDDSADRFFLDQWAASAESSYNSEHTVIVYVDDHSLKKYRDDPVTFWGPHFAEAIQKLRSAGAIAVGVDYFFSISAEAWLKKMRLPGNNIARVYDAPMREQLSKGDVTLIAIASRRNNDTFETMTPIIDYVYSLPGMAGDLGLANVLTDIDGVVRYYTPSMLEPPVEPRLTFAFQLAKKWIEFNKAKGVGASESFSDNGNMKFNDNVELRRIAWTGPAGTVPSLSFKDLIENEKSLEIESLVSGKIAIIAPGQSGMNDYHATPFGSGFSVGKGAMTGAEIHANIIETLLSGKTYNELSSFNKRISEIVSAALTVLLIYRRKPGWGSLLTLSFALLILGYSRWLYFNGVVFAPSSSIFAAISGYLYSLGLRLSSEEKGRRRIAETFSRYVDPELVESILKSDKTPELGGESAEVTILFSDIRNFTTLSENLPPEVVVELLNSYFSEIVDAVKKHGGMVDKFIGDAVMAVFGAPVPHEDHSLRALKAAFDIMEIAAGIDARMKDICGIDQPFRAGAGIHSGRAVIGNIGSKDRMDYTAIGDTVNIASRLEGLTKERGSIIVASQSVIHQAETFAAQTGSVIDHGEFFRVKLKGRGSEIQACDLYKLVHQNEN